MFPHQIRRQEDVRRYQELYELLQGDIAVVEDHVLLNPKASDPLLQGKWIAFPIALAYLRMGSPNHEIEDLGELPDHFRHRLDGVLDPLVWGKEAEGEDEGPPFRPELVLVIRRV